MQSKVKNLIPEPIKNSFHFSQAFLGALLFSFPSRKLKIIGVTGTDGKTTTASLIYHILHTNGVKTSLISTVEAKIGGESIETGLHVTTPDPIALQKLLKRMVDAGSEYGVVETTSHGLAQERVAIVRFFAGVVTNVTHEHLDYHKTYDRYLAAKAKILRGVKFRVLNVDDSSFDTLKDQGTGQLLTYGIREKADFKANKIVATARGLSFEVEVSDKEKKPEKVAIKTPLTGEYNVYNILAAFSLCHSLGVKGQKIAKSLESFTGVAGRMQDIDEGQDFRVVVDFAHTPAGLQAALTSLKKQTKGKLIAIFGSAGERDIGKRPLMGRISARFADISVFTAEDPRSEDVNKIIDAMVQGAKFEEVSEGQDFFQIPDREQAVSKAIIELAKADDTVAIFGKGHEKSMNIKGVEYPWSDQEAASKAIKERLKK